jgi:superfamily II DNA helicase RecQ
MDIRIFTLPFDKIIETFDDQIVKSFLLTKKVIDIKSDFFKSDGHIYWTVLVIYDTIMPEEKRDESLSEADQQLMMKLKEWRKEKALSAGFPVYLICNNAQIKEIVQKKPKTFEGLKSVKGFGKSKLEKYGREILQVIKSFQPEKAIIDK